MRSEIIKNIEGLLQSRPALREEINWKLDVDRDYEYDLVDAFLEVVSDLDDGVGHSRTVLRQAREVLIEIGICRSVTEEELSRIFITKGKPYDFRLKGTKYVCKNYDKWEKEVSS